MKKPTNNRTTKKRTTATETQTESKEKQRITNQIKEDMINHKEIRRNIITKETCKNTKNGEIETHTTDLNK